MICKRVMDRFDAEFQVFMFDNVHKGLFSVRENVRRWLGRKGG